MRWDSVNLLRTENLVLKELSFDDKEDLHKLFSNPQVTNMMGVELMPGMSDVLRWLLKKECEVDSREAFDWSIHLKSDDQFTGRCGIRAINWENNSCEFSCALLESFWGRGFGSEVLKCLSDFSFNRLGFHRIEARLWPNNLRMAHVLEKCGFACEGSLKGDYYFMGKYGDTLVYGLSNQS